MTILPSALFAQSTQGTDFWVTLMRGDRGKNGTDNGYENLLLKFSAHDATKVYIENTYTGYIDSVEVGDNDIQELLLNSYAESCYVTDDDEEAPANRALHVTSKKPISLIAANYKDKSFDVAAILPTKALLSEYRIQCYSPSAHKEDDGHFPHGSHFAIVAAENNVVVDITPTAPTHGGKAIGTTFSTDTLQKGQVYYVWSGPNEGVYYDFTGTIVKSRNNKKIAVFNGNSHTNIPIQVRDRDHIFSQAMPINYWGRRFAITSSLTTIDNQKSKTNTDYKKLDGYFERIDKIRVQALVDSTVVWIDGRVADTIAFNDPSSTDHQHHFYEFDFGKQQNSATAGYTGDGHTFYDGVSHYIETSCPCAVHLFMTSNQYDYSKKEYKVDGVTYKYCNGDPSEIWVNPIEQKIKELTFGTFETKQVTDHFLNIVTSKDNVASVRLDGDDISDKFQDLLGNSDYVFTRITGLENGTHTLVSDSGFIAHVYGFGQRESYGYPAGGDTKDLSSTLYINDEPYSPENNKLCGDESAVFECKLDYTPDSIYWYFGDGTDTLTYDTYSIEHFYDVANRGVVNYEAYVLIYREVGYDDNCYKWSDYDRDSIDFKVQVGLPKIEVKSIEIPRCITQGTDTDIQIILDNPAKVDLTSDSVSITFNQAANEAGFDDDLIRTQGDTMLIIHVPGDTPDRTPYSMHIHIGSECESTVFDKDIEFHMEYYTEQLEQRYNNVLGLMRSAFEGKQLSDFVWFHDNDTVHNQASAVLYLDESEPQNSGLYHVCYTVIEEGKEPIRECTCPIQFDAEMKQHSFKEDNITVTALYASNGDKVFVNAEYDEEDKDIQCYAQWFDVSGRAVEGGRYDLPNGGRSIDVPRDSGLYLLRVVTGKATRSFKFIINH